MNYNILSNLNLIENILYFVLQNKNTIYSYNLSSKSSEIYYKAPKLFNISTFYKKIRTLH